MFVFVFLDAHSTMFDIEWIMNAHLNENVSTSIYL